MLVNMFEKRLSIDNINYNIYINNYIILIKDKIFIIIFLKLCMYNKMFIIINLKYLYIIKYL